MNILVIGTGIIEQKLINFCKESKYLEHLYTASNNPLVNIPNVEYVDFEELIFKAKALKIDIILLENKAFIQEGIVELLKKNKLNIISVNSKWYNLEKSRIIAKELMNYYEINTPRIIKAPMTFPIVIKTNTSRLSKIVYTMDELVQLRENLGNELYFLEDYLEGFILDLVSLWDGKNILYFPHGKSLSEVQLDRLDFYKTRLTIMFSEEKADFIGFFVTKLIWSKNDWHVLEYKMHLDDTVDLNLQNKDFIYILDNAIYQKLNEISY